MGKSDWRSRLILEKRQLETRYEDLKVFIDSEGFEVLEQADKHLLLLQAHYMQGYLRILDERFVKTFPKGRAQPPAPSEGLA